MQLKQAIESFHLLGQEIEHFLRESSAHQQEWNETLQMAEHENGWFTQENIKQALESIALWLDKDKLNTWSSTYPEITWKSKKNLSVGVIMAGNIPLVGFHDFVCVLLSGNILYAKLSHSDARLLPFISERLIALEPQWKKRIHFVEKLHMTIDAVIATGSNNTARHFEYYFKDTPHIIRKNRNGVAVLDGTETPEELSDLGSDIFNYFGLGCRNVAKLYVPSGYNFENFFKSIEPHKTVIQHNKYHSNYVYNRTIYLMDGKKFTDNGFLAVIESKAPSSPIAVLNFEEYKSLRKLGEHLTSISEQIQCVSISKRLKDLFSPYINTLSLVSFGETQCPSLSDYADGVDVVNFLIAQQSKV